MGMLRKKSKHIAVQFILLPSMRTCSSQLVPKASQSGICKQAKSSQIYLDLISRG